MPTRKMGFEEIFGVKREDGRSWANKGGGSGKMKESLASAWNLRFASIALGSSEEGSCLGGEGTAGREGVARGTGNVLVQEEEAGVWSVCRVKALAAASLAAAGWSGSGQPAGSPGALSASP